MVQSVQQFNQRSHLDAIFSSQNECSTTFISSLGGERTARSTETGINSYKRGECSLKGQKIPTKISLPEKLAERFKEKFGYKKGNFSTGIKIEIRKCIRKNLKISSVKRFSSAEITAAFDEAFHRISEKGEMLDGRRDKNERVKREYRWAFNAMLDTLTNSIKKGN